MSALGSGLIEQNQYAMAAAMQMAEKIWAQGPQPVAMRRKSFSLPTSRCCDGRPRQPNTI